MVLVAHAYAGAVIAATTNERVRSLVFIAALAPDEGETLADVFYREKPHPEAPRLVPDAMNYLDATGAIVPLSPTASPERAALLAATQRRIAVTCIQEKAPRPAWKRSLLDLVAEEDRMISPTTQHFMAERIGAGIRSESFDDSPLVTAPEPSSKRSSRPAANWWCDRTRQKRNAPPPCRSSALLALSCDGRDDGYRKGERSHHGRRSAIGRSTSTV